MGELEDSDGGIPASESTEEYPTGTSGYSASGDTHAGAETQDHAGSETQEPSPADGPRPEPHWKRAGFSSFREYIDYLNRHKPDWELAQPGAPMPAPELPGAEVGEITTTARLPRRVRQVNVKLRPGEADDLKRAARMYGLASATLARALVNRGVRAILQGEG